ncbi:MAG TPA: hypothetical protein VMY39_03000 [Planctomycetota bacterium]|nr:hypothetical protein [Planctomycetota bacterium]
MTSSWSKDYPDREALRREVRCMTDVFIEVLLEIIGEDAIAGVYFKGSAQKAWDSPVDYVPELSDVDLHVLFADDADVEKHVGTAEQALRIQSEVERRYFAKLQEPRHTARPQLIALNHLEKQEDYLGPAEKTVTTLHGAPPRWGDFADVARVRDIARRQLLDLGDYVSKFPFRAIDKPGRYVWELLRHLVWNVSPVGPKVLILKGVAPTDAWRMNRTAIVDRLRDLSEEPLAADYADFYLAGWDYFLSGYADGEAARRALTSGVSALRRALDLARTTGRGA